MIYKSYVCIEQALSNRKWRNISGIESTKEIYQTGIRYHISYLDAKNLTEQEERGKFELEGSEGDGIRGEPNMPCLH